MPASLTSLTTRAECDDALDSLSIELGTYQHRTANLDYADTVAGRAATSTASRLAKATADVAHYITEVARAGQTPAELRRAQSALISATAQRDRLALATTALTGSAAYLSAVDADQVEGQVTILTAAQTAVTAHKATLPA